MSALKRDIGVRIRWSVVRGQLVLVSSYLSASVSSREESTGVSGVPGMVCAVKSVSRSFQLVSSSYMQVIVHVAVTTISGGRNTIRGRLACTGLRSRLRVK